MDDRLERLAVARLYFVCDDRSDGFLHAVLGGGVDIIQLRLKHADDDEVLRTASRFADICSDHDALFILNDRPDLVAEAGADGVHVGQDDMPVERARELIGPGRIIGLSTHSLAQVRAADGADYIGVGPVHETPTKPGRPAVGTQLIRDAARHASVPFFAIGGIDRSNVADVVAAGARRIAVLRALTEADHPGLAVRELRAAVLAVSEPAGDGVGPT